MKKAGKATKAKKTEKAKEADQVLVRLCTHHCCVLYSNSNRRSTVCRLFYTKHLCIVLLLQMDLFIVVHGTTKYINMI